jgi:hypothetical protein
MARFIEAQSSSARKADGRGNAPFCLEDFGCHCTLCRERRDGLTQVVAHEVDDSSGKIVVSMALNELTISGVNPEFTGRHREDQPSLARIDRLQIQHIAEEGAVGPGIATVEEKVGSVDHDGRDFNPIPPIMLARQSTG